MYTPLGREEFVRQCVQACACKRDIKVHNNAINSQYSHSSPESIGLPHHISISDHVRTRVHTVPTVLFTDVLSEAV